MKKLILPFCLGMIINKEKTIVKHIFSGIFEAEKIFKLFLKNLLTNRVL